MLQRIIGSSSPTAQLCINKSRLKVYNKETSPTYYLTNGQEFQIELFNPTTDTILAKIQLNGKYISQGGLVLRPGERVFLERYIDVAKKFLFETYEVANTSEVKQAIRDNGDFRVEFYRESKPLPFQGNIALGSFAYPNNNNDGLYYKNLLNNQFTGGGGTGGVNTFYNQNISSYNTSMGASLTSTNSEATYDALSFNDTLSDNQSAQKDIASLKKLSLRSSKTIETGRVEAGASSDQKLDYVDKTFDIYPFYTLNYKMLPVSQKVNTVADINVAQYCTNCGTKQKSEYKFCPTCGRRK